MLLLAPGLSSLNIDLGTAINEAKIAHGAKNNGVVELRLKWQRHSTRKAQERLKRLGQSQYCRTGKSIWSKWKTPKNMVEDRYIQAGKQVWEWRPSSEDRGRWTHALPPLPFHQELMPEGKEECLGVQQCFSHLPSTFAARTMAAVSSSCVCFINLADWAQNSAWEQTLPPEREVLMRAVCGNTT